MLDKFKTLFKREQPKPEPAKPAEPTPVAKKPRKPRKPKAPETKLSDKELATAAGEPYVSILKVDVDPNNINSGTFELDWNDKFVLNLIRAGYKQRDDDVDADIVDRWFTQVCRNVALELYEQQQADPVNRGLEDVRPITRRDLGNGRSEVS